MSGETPILERLLRIRETLCDASERWGRAASATRHQSDARNYAVLSHDIAELAHRVEIVRLQWVPQMNAPERKLSS